MPENKRERSSGNITRRFVLIASALLLLGGACDACWGAWVMKSDWRTWLTSDTVVQPSILAPTPATTGVGALGRLEPGWKVYQIGPGMSNGAQVEALFVKEGDEVKAGTVIALLDTHTRQQAALTEATAQVLAAKARLSLVKAGTKAEELVAQQATIEQLRVSFRKAEADFHRAQIVRSQGVISSEEFELKQSVVEMAKATHRQAEAVLAALKVVRPQDVAVAEAELAKAEAGVARAVADLDATKVRSPIDGRVLKIYSWTGERVGSAGIADIGDTASMHAVAEVYEKDALRVRAGQRAVVKVQSLTGELSGEVIHVGWKVGRQVVFDNDPVKDTDARVVEVRIKLDAAGSTRVAGLTYARVEVRIDGLSPSSMEKR